MSETTRAGATDVLTALHVLEYPYKRSVGPVIGRFLTGLIEGRIQGIKTSSGKVMVPPVEYDPETAAALSEFVDVADTGVVETWAWVAEPRQYNPLHKPFALHSIRLRRKTRLCCYGSSSW